MPIPNDPVMYRVKVCWPKGGSWVDVAAATSQEAADKTWPSEYLYDENKSGAHHLHIEVARKGTAIVERFDVRSQCQPIPTPPGFNGAVGVAYKVTPIAKENAVTLAIDPATGGTYMKETP